MGSRFRRWLGLVVLIRTISCLVCTKVIGPIWTRPQLDPLIWPCKGGQTPCRRMYPRVPLPESGWLIRTPLTPPVYGPGWTLYFFVWSSYCCFCCAHHYDSGSVCFCNTCNQVVCWMYHHVSCAPCKVFPYLNFSDSAVLVPFSHMPHPPHFNPVPLPNRGNLPGRKEHLLHKVGQLPLVGYPHNHQRSFISKVGKGEIQQLVWGEPPVSCEFVYVSVFRKLVTTPAVIYVNSAKY